MFAFLVALLASKQFAVFTRQQSQNLLKMWKPQALVVDDGTVLFFKGNVKHYVQSRLHLEEKETFSIGTMVNDKLNMFVCSRGPYVHTIECCLWADYTRKSHAFSFVKERHDELFPDFLLVAGERMDKASLRAWEAISR